MAKNKNPAGGGTPAGAGSLDTEISGSSPNNTKSKVSGATTANALPPITALVWLPIDKLWRVSIDGVGDVEISTGRLRSFRKFNVACMNQLNRCFARVSAADWSLITDKAMHSTRGRRK